MNSATKITVYYSMLKARPPFSRTPKSSDFLCGAGETIVSLMAEADPALKP